MPDRKIEIARTLFYGDGHISESCREDMAQALGAIEAANKLGHKVCCDVMNQQIPGKEEEGGTPFLSFFIFTGQERRA